VIQEFRSRFTHAALSLPVRIPSQTGHTSKIMSGEKKGWVGRDSPPPWIEGTKVLRFWSKVTAAFLHVLPSSILCIRHCVEGL
jgi:hypothetical protein